MTKKYSDNRLQSVAEEEFRNNLDFIANHLANHFGVSTIGVTKQLNAGRLTPYEASQVMVGSEPINYFGELIYVRTPLPK